MSRTHIAIDLPNIVNTFAFFKRNHNKKAKLEIFKNTHLTNFFEKYVFCYDDIAEIVIFSTPKYAYINRWIKFGIEDKKNKKIILKVYADEFYVNKVRYYKDIDKQLIAHLEELNLFEYERLVFMGGDWCYSVPLFTLGKMYDIEIITVYHLGSFPSTYLKLNKLAKYKKIPYGNKDLEEDSKSLPKSSKALAREMR